MSKLETTSIKSIIGNWSKLDDFVSGLNQFITNPVMRVNKGRVHKWIQRDAIPPEYWYAVTEAGKLNGCPITYEVLALHAWNKKVLAA